MKKRWQNTTITRPEFAASFGSPNFITYHSRQSIPVTLVPCLTTKCSWTAGIQHNSICPSRVAWDTFGLWPNWLMSIMLASCTTQSISSSELLAVSSPIFKQSTDSTFRGPTITSRWAFPYDLETWCWIHILLDFFSSLWV